MLYKAGFQAVCVFVCTVGRQQPIRSLSTQALHFIQMSLTTGVITAGMMRVGVCDLFNSSKPHGWGNLTIHWIIKQFMQGRRVLVYSSYLPSSMCPVYFNPLEADYLGSKRVLHCITSLFVT